MRSPNIKKFLIHLGLVGAAALSVSAASAAPITNWTYSVSSQFRFNPGDTAFQADPNGCEQLLSNSISWGDASPCGGPRAGPNGPLGGGGRSGIGIDDSPQGGALVTGGTPQPANTYTHSNFGVTSTDRSLLQATIASTLTLTPQGSPIDYTFDAVYRIYFAETSNATPCTVTSPAGNPCNDIWVLVGSLNNPFSIGGDDYFFHFYAEPDLTLLSAAACDAANTSAPCSGFTTIEGQANAVGFLLAITTDRIEIPEPSSLLLLGAGLLAVVGIRRRRR